MTRSQGALALAIRPHITIVDGQPTTTTHDIAEVYGKEHSKVLAIVRQRIAEAGEWGVANFRDTPYTNAQNGQTYAVIRMTKKGFHFVVGKFTGAKAVQHQIAFADEFERMEAELGGKHNREAESPAIDVSDLLLSGQCDCTMPLSPALNTAIKQQAWVLAGEAYDLIQEHLRRRVAYEAASGHGEVYEQTALRVIRRGSLNDALAHQHMLNLRFLKEHAGSLLRMTQKFVDEMREAQHLAPSPATQP